ncbi:hypothetical protein FSOLCH5_014054 [Fusarium solani]
MINAVLQMAVRRNLGRRLADIGLDPVRRDKIIADALDDVSYIRDAPAQIAKAITTSYVHALESTHWASLGLVTIGFILILSLRQYRAWSSSL